MTHFERFGLPPTFDVDVKALEGKFRELSLQHHPDRVAAADARTRVQALEATTALNEALKVLKDPIRRATYLLTLKGVDLDDESAPAHRAMPMEFLEEVMERREALEAARSTGDLSAAQKMATEVEQLQKTALGVAVDALKRDDVSTAAHQLGRVRYFTRFLDEVAAFEEESEG